MTKIKDIISVIQELAPVSFQESYDNSGLQTGDQNDKVNGVLLTLDCTLPVLEEAIAAGCNLIITHHPVIFKPLKKLTGTNEVEQIIIKAIQNQIAIYACHTNLDNVLTGVNAKICQKLNLTNLQVLAPKAGNLLKLVTFCPLDSTEEVLTGMHQAGAGKISDYQDCSFKVTGTGRFTPTGQANPTIGRLNIPEEVIENRIEVIFPDHLKTNILKALHKVHPYEEVACDIYRLENPNPEVGAGMVGLLPDAISAAEFIPYLKDKMHLPQVRHTELGSAKIQKVAVCGGAGSFLIKDAMHHQADIFITADLKYHEFFAPEGKMILVDIGHYESEVFTKEIFYDIILKNFSNFAVLKSKVNTNPVRYT